MLVMTGANSAVGLRSMPVRYLFLDEVDGYPLDVEGEGDAISLAEAPYTARSRGARSSSSRRRRSQGHRRIEREYEASDQRRYLCRVRIAPTGSGCVRAAALGQRATGDRCLHLRESC